MIRLDNTKIMVPVKSFDLFLNNWIFLCIRFKILGILDSIFLYLKLRINKHFLYFFYEAIHKLKPVLWYRVHKIKRKNKKKIFKLKVFFLHRNVRVKKAIFWLILAIKAKHIPSLKFKVLSELYSINFLQNSFSLRYKFKHYNNLLINKASKHFSW